MADEVWVDVLANMSPFATGFKRGATQVARDAGRQAGNEFTRAMADNSAGATDGLVKELEISAKKSEAALGKLSRRSPPLGRRRTRPKPLSWTRR